MSTLRAEIARVTAAVALFVASASAQSGGHAARPAAAPKEELRAFWVDAFHAGIRTPEEAAQLVADAKKANINTLIVQVRRRGDALYTKSFEPPLDDAAYDPQFDALAHIIEVAHREGMQVHAWVNAMPVWREPTPPRDPRHVFNLHGPSAAGTENWLTASPTGEQRFPVGYFLDPGHPAAAAYTAEVYLNLVRNYDLDGIHFDYIRYPETTERLPRGAAVGYNPTSLARFQRATGREDRPAPDDPAWMAWRRQQVTQLVRRVYVEAKALKPQIQVSAALIPWGKPPTSEKDFDDAAPMQRVFQDWHSWLKEGILDVAIPMNYAREHDAVVRGWFDGWIRWEKRHKHGRKVAVGIGAYVNTPEGTLAQIARARKSERGGAADGVSFFSYANLFPAAPAAVTAAATTAPGSPPAVPPFTRPSDDNRSGFFAEQATGEPAAFAEPAAIPKLDWIERPQEGSIAGIASESAGKPVDGARIRLRRAGWWPFRRTRQTVADGNGWFGFTGVRPGRYQLRVEARGLRAPEIQVEVAAGQVARANL